MRSESAEFGSARVRRLEEPTIRVCLHQGNTSLANGSSAGMSSPEVWSPVEAHHWSQGGIPHSPIQDDIYKGYLIPKGAWIVGNSFAIHVSCCSAKISRLILVQRNPREYPEPNEFKPERFMDGNQQPFPNATGITYVCLFLKIIESQSVTLVLSAGVEELAADRHWQRKVSTAAFPLFFGLSRLSQVSIQR